MDSYKPSQLDIKVGELSEKYFDDMRLGKGSVIEKYLMLPYMDGHEEYSLPDEWANLLNANNYKYCVGKLEDGISGETNNVIHTVTIAQEYENDDTVLLHEMIHVFEYLYDYDGERSFYNPYGEKIDYYIYPSIREALLISLYNDLKLKIPDLDNRILSHANIYSGVNIANEGGNHDILFFLKSLDLDIRCGFKLGTVCGYGRNNMSDRPRSMK